MLNINNDNKKQKKLVAIVVPLSNRKELTPEEKISLKHLIHYLGKYDKYVIIPKSLEVDYPGFGIKRFGGKYFGSLEAHKKLLLSPSFYKAFKEYKFIFTYHLDALVFSDQLQYWCKMDYDYIGAPFLKSISSPEQGFSGVGNSGFCLRKTGAFFRIIGSPKYKLSYLTAECWRKYLKINPLHEKIWKFPKKHLQRSKIYGAAKHNASSFARNDDRFLFNNAKRYYPEYNVAPIETALRFAFECSPRYCFKENNHTLPFGCHAWYKYDKDFWESYLLK